MRMNTLRRNRRMARIALHWALTPLRVAAALCLILKAI